MREIQREKGDLPYLSSNYIVTISQTRINNEVTWKGRWVDSRLDQKWERNKRKWMPWGSSPDSIIMETTAPYSPAQNGIAEQLNWTLLERTWAIIFSKNLPKTLWPEAIAYACYIKNRSLTQALGSDIMPFQALFTKKLDIACLEEFGTNCWVMVPDQCQAKLDPKAEEHLFVGIAEYVKAWKYYNKISKHVQISRNITFDQSDTTLYPILDVNCQWQGHSTVATIGLK